MKYRIVLFIGLLTIFNGCDDFQWDLQRDNPLDSEVDIDSDIVFSKYEVYEDNNGDEQINKGESIKLKVYLKNNGERANGVKATITCSNSFISSLSPTTAISYSTYSYYDYIDPGDEANPESSSSYLSFNVSNTTPDGTVITFNIEITDESNNRWTDSFTITVVRTGILIEFSKFDLYEDNNNDDQINKGESIKLKVYLKNNGSSRANSVKATITCSSSYVSSLRPITAISYSTYSYYDYIDPGDEAYPESSSSYLSFNVSNTTPDGTVITFNIEITDESNNTWTDSFTITVVRTGALIEFSKFEVYEDNNYDDQINKGESIKLKVYLKNNGISRANSVKATISCSSSFISSLSPTTAISYSTISYYDYIDPGYEANPESSSSYLSFNVSNTTPDGTVITFNIEITDESDNTWTDSFSITVVATGADIGFSRFDVYNDSNNDQQINPGESIKLKVYLINNGSSRANGVTTTISCSSGYISSLSPTTSISYSTYSYYDYMDPGDEAYPEFISSYLSFDVSVSTPVGTVITYDVSITDESSNVWTDNFSITVE